MAWASLKMISLGSLLILSEQHDASSSRRPGCISQSEMDKRASRFRRIYWDRLTVPIELLQQPRDTRTCAQAAVQMRGDLNNRSLAPWTYSINRDNDRFPNEIAFAECLCQGCIINQLEDLSYNSVPVFAPLMVLKKTRCTLDPDTYTVKKDFITVSVACTCAVPNYTD